MQRVESYRVLAFRLREPDVDNIVHHAAFCLGGNDVDKADASQSWASLCFTTNLSNLINSTRNSRSRIISALDDCLASRELTILHAGLHRHVIVAFPRLVVAFERLGTRHKFDCPPRNHTAFPLLASFAGFWFLSGQPPTAPKIQT